MPPTRIDARLLKQLGTETLQILGEHFEGLHRLPVKPKIQPGQLAPRFPLEAPRKPTSYEKLLEKVKTDILPSATHWQHPRFMAYYPASTSVPAVLSETIIGSIGSVALQWSAHPIATELEVVIMDWLASMFGFHDDFFHRSGRGGGFLKNTAGEAIAEMMVCARIHKHLKSNPSLSRDEAFYQDSSKFVAYMSDQSHFSGHKATRMAGLQLRLVASTLVDGNWRLEASALRAAVDADKAAGLVPVFLQLNYGSTNTSGTDDIAAFKDIAKAEGLWVHVDAAYAGAAWALEEFRSDASAASDVAASININGSKWFLCGMDSSFIFIRDRKLLLEVFSASGAYMTTAGDSIYSPELKDWSMPLGRRFRSLRIWLVLEYFGVEGIQSYLRDGIKQADWLRSKVDSHPEFEQAAKTRFGLICLALVGPKGQGEEGTTAMATLSQHLEAAGFLSYPSVLNGKAILRIALGGAATTQEDVEALWNEILLWLQKSSRKEAVE